MRIILFILVFPVFTLLSQTNTPENSYISDTRALNTQTNMIDEMLMVNMNLSQNVNPQNEPSVRILRTNPNIVVAAWRDFRLGYNPPVRRIGYAYSTNGGNSWSAPLMLPDPQPNHATQSDPVLMNDGNGAIYLTSTSRDPSNTLGQTVVYKSTNNGVTFTELATAVSSTYFEDKEWIACDLTPSSPYYNNLYITWTRINVGIRCIKSTNGGLNWTTPVVVGDNVAGQGSNVAIGTNNYVYVVWGQSGIKFDKSTNGGTSFGADYSLSTNNNQIGFPFICVDYTTHSTRGNIYVVWDDNRNGTYDVWFQRSTDAGTTWMAAPVRINDVITNNQYKPYIQCDTSGNLHTIFYDERLGAGMVNAYYAYSSDMGNSWTNMRLSDSSFTLTSVNSDVRNGEYIGLDAYAGKVIPVWTDDRAGTPNQEVYTTASIILAAGNSGNEVPVQFSLQQNYPNPFNPSTRISYTVGKTSLVSLEVYDMLGRRVAFLVNTTKLPGSYSVNFDGSNLTSGIYFCKLTAGDYRDTKKMILIK